MAEKDIKIISKAKTVNNEKNDAYEAELDALRTQKEKADAAAIKARMENAETRKSEKIYKALDRIRGLIKKR